jgi:hypothetical protein
LAADCVTLWIGDSLGPVERACLRSVLRQGHSIALYCYDRVGGVPRGVQIMDASDVIAREKIIFHRKGRSVALFADWFRYELQKRQLGTWLDTDNYLIAPFDLGRDYLFGEYAPGKIANGVLRLPAESPMLAALLDLFQTERTPDWLPWRWYLPARLREFIVGRVDVSRLAWGCTGPHAMTALAEKFGLSSEALPCDVFNPAPWTEARWILDPRMALEDVVTSRSVGVHLWNQIIRGFKNDPAPKGSFLARLHEEGRD